MPKDLLSTPLKEISAADLEELVTAKVEEVGRQIEFKLELKVGQDSEKKEFCTDVASFANAIGGVMLVGIQADQGVASAVMGIEATDRDALVLRIEQILQAGISPRIPWVGVRAIDLGNGRTVVVIQVPQSPIAPHAVGKDGTYRFFTRGENGKMPMDIPQVRRSMMLSEGLRERLRSYRAERVARIVAGDGMAKLNPGSSVIMHLVPLNALHDPTEYDLTAFGQRNDDLITMTSERSYQRDFNLDGVFDYWGPDREAGIQGYVQLFQSGGIIESVDAAAMFVNKERYPHAIGAHVTVRGLTEALGRYLLVLSSLGAAIPYYCMITYTGMRGRILWLSNYTKAPFGCDRDSLFLPEIPIVDASLDPGTLLRPAIDALWRTWGMPKCPWYDESGKLKIPG